MLLPALQVLVERGGYIYLDVRPAMELGDTGRVKGCVNIPIMDAKWVYNTREQKKELQSCENDDFVEQVGGGAVCVGCCVHMRVGNSVPQGKWELAGPAGHCMQSMD